MFFAASEAQLAEWVRAGLAIMQHTLKRWPTIATHKDLPMNKTARQPKCWTNESWVESDRETWCRQGLCISEQACLGWSYSIPTALFQAGVLLMECKEVDHY